MVQISTLKKRNIRGGNSTIKFTRYQFKAKNDVEGYNYSKGLYIRIESRWIFLDFFENIVLNKSNKTKI